MPRYAPLRRGAWTLQIVPMCLSHGYWSGTVPVEHMATLVRGHDCWMSMTPLEMESQEIGVRLAGGHVLIFGLGMGWAAAATACIPGVERVTVVESDPDVIALNRALDIFAQLPEAARARIHVVEADAFAYTPDAPVDLLMPDIWLRLVSDGRLGEVRRMQANVGSRTIYFWGQELELARHAVAAGRALDLEGIAATVAGTGLPLVGTSTPGHVDKLAAAARHWMRGRWLPGSQPPF